MGACFNDMTLDGKMTKDEVAAKFDDRCRQDGHECGHSYSGSFSQFDGLIFTGKDFDTYDEAYEWVTEHGDKWGPAVCVRHKLYHMPKSATKHDEQRRKLEWKICLANEAVHQAYRKMQINNRTKKPAYVTAAEANREKIKAQVQPKIDERTAKIAAIIEKAAAKSKKSVWYLGGWCSS